MTNNNYSISVIIPAHNEEQGIENVVLHTMKTFQSLDFDFEIIIVDDNSVDRTGEIANEIANRNPSVRSFRHEKKLGSGGAFKTGIAHAKKDYVMFVPVDNPLDVEDMETYLPRMGVCDIVVGFRVERVGYSRFARFASFTYNRILVPLLFNIGVGDVNWISIYQRNLFTDDIITFSSTSLFWLVEILIQARRKYLIVAEVPAKMKKRMYGRATNTRFLVMWRTFTDMIKYFWKIRREDKS